MKKIIFVLIVCMLFGNAGFVQASVIKPGYYTRAEVNNKIVTLNVYIENVEAVVGRFALDFDQSKVSLLSKTDLGEYVEATNTSDVLSVVNKSDQSNIIQEGEDTSKLLSVETGYVMFAWMAEESKVSAVGSRQLIATLMFKIKDGMSTDNFDQNTFKLKNVVKNEVLDWDSGAMIMEDGSCIRYKYGVQNEPLCNVIFEYTGNTRLSLTDGHKITITFRDSKNNLISGNIIVNSKQYNIDQNGQIALYMPAGSNIYQIYKDGYEDKVGIIDVKDSDISENIVLLTASDVVALDKQSLAISYYTGDNQDSVTQHITLPSVGVNNTTVKWESENPGIITGYGFVTRQESDEKVKLKATISKNSATAVKEYVLNVKAKVSTESEGLSTTSTTVVPTATPTATSKNQTGSGSGGGGGLLMPVSTTSTATPTVSPTTTPTLSPTLAPEVTSSTSTPESNDLTPTPDNSKINNENSKAFTDIEGIGWAKEHINSLVKNGIIQGTSSDKFSPNEYIKRGDFIMLIGRIFNFKGEIDSNFTDVKKSSYYYKMVGIAKKMNIISGKNKNDFEPEGYITRQDMFVITQRALKQFGISKGNTDKNVLNKFKDKNSISPYAIEAVSYLIENKFLSGSDLNKIFPLKNATRAETAVFLDRIYESK